MEFLKILLFPFSLLYGLLAHCRNKLFDWGVLPSESFKIPVISVGNLANGGTGKTPHIEYLIRLLQGKFNIATLSRGYGRSTKGYFLADKEATFSEIGDESLQYKEKFDGIEVAVDARRRRGIKVLKNTISNLHCILLDDAFQHRYVKPGLSILLTDYHNLYINDYPMPTGSLREFRLGAKRADIIIVTKTFSVLSPITERRLRESLKLREHQKLYFTWVNYGEFTPLFKGVHFPVKGKYNTILLFSGIANSYPLHEYLRGFCSELVVMEFSDHHKYSAKDIRKIKNKYKDIFSRNKVIITTEKDAMRIIKTNLLEELKKLPVFYVPIKIEFHNNADSAFNKQIMDYVQKNP